MTNRIKITKIVAWLYLILIIFFPISIFSEHLADWFDRVIFTSWSILPVASLVMLILGSLAWKDRPRSRFVSTVTIINYVLFLPIVAGLTFFLYFAFAVITNPGAIGSV